MFTLEDLKKELLKNDDYKKLVEKRRRNVLYRTARMLEEARTIRGITQKELAQKIGTQQPAIARLESGKKSPSIRILDKIAKAFGTYLIPPIFPFMKDIEYEYDFPKSELSTTSEKSNNNYICFLAHDQTTNFFLGETIFNLCINNKTL